MISSDTTGSLAPVDHLDVVPNEALGPFKLGDSFWTVTEVLKNYRSTFRVVDISWDEENPASSTILLKLDGYITLIFPSTPPPSIPSLSTPSSSSSSTVKKSQPRFTYAGQTLHSARAPLDKNRVSTLFGPTFEPKTSPGQEDSRGRMTCYPGIGFEWSSSAGRDPIAKANTEEEEEEKWTFPRKCIKLYFHTHNGDHGNDNNNNPYPIELHRTLAQDLLLDLGPPARKYTKQDGRFEGMYGGKGGEEGGKVWWNYFHLGLDFLVDEDEAGVVVKVMVHSNIPGTALFQRYARCPWEIVVPGSPTRTVYCRDSLKAATTALSQAHGNGVHTDTSKSSKSTAMASKPKDRNSNSNSPAEIEAAAMTLDRTTEPGFEGDHQHRP
ncbi:hypothetical protein FFLO_01928 [Filobasidium floriforme]|uniref:Uncharacterized protein n=1 Tax=Filobasidium floriforme TaxID=5210 RepID=A0A8K0JTU1_9TREE|nr:hypothetical protein FFLO_01928 [Filobasidium floriforme]